MSVVHPRLDRVASDIPTWAGSIDEAALAALLGMGGERNWLDYKRQLDLSTGREAVELAKDAGAMMILGGYVLVGAYDNGQPSGDVEHLGLFDTATVHDKLAKYLPKRFEVRVAVHQYQGQNFALIYIAPHPDGFCIFEHDGAYQDGKDQKVVFRRGDVFARHGTKSERWNQDDIAMIKRRLQADADQSRDQRAEAVDLLTALPAELGEGGIWLGLAVVPEYQPSESATINREAVQEFLRDWEASQAPLEAFGLETATYRQQGCIVITSQAGMAESPQWWRLALYDTGSAVGAHVLAQNVSESDFRTQQVLPAGVLNGHTIPVRRDRVEIELLTLLDLLTAHAAAVGAGGRVQLVATLVAANASNWQQVALFKALADDIGKHGGWMLASARAHLPREAVVMKPAGYTVWLAEMRDPRLRHRAAYRLTAELLAIFSVDSPSILRDDGTLDPYGGASSKQQLIYQHARHVGLPVDAISPIQRQQKLEEDIQAAKERFRQR